MPRSGVRSAPSKQLFRYTIRFDSGPLRGHCFVPVGRKRTYVLLVLVCWYAGAASAGVFFSAAAGVTGTSILNEPLQPTFMVEPAPGSWKIG